LKCSLLFASTYHARLASANKCCATRECPCERKGGLFLQPGFFLPVRVLSRLFRRRFLEVLLNHVRKGPVTLV